MNILLVLYGDFSCNSANPLVIYARELHLLGHSCALAVSDNLETAHDHGSLSFRPVLFDDVLANPESVFPDGRHADVIHASTPREVIRCFITLYMSKHPTPLVIYLEDNESWISNRALGFNEATVFQQTEGEISERLPHSLSHPFLYKCFIGLADAVAVIQDKLKFEVPPWVHCETVMLGVDLQFFSPRPPDLSLRLKYGVSECEKLIVYHGGLNGFVKPAIKALCMAVGLINQQGYKCRLLRTGPFALDFLGELPPETLLSINDLGLLSRSELPNLLALADVFVQPGNIDPFEDLRLPGKLPEFLAMGRPVVMPDTNISHLFSDGFDSILLRSGSAVEIAEKCIGIFSNPDRAGRIGRAGRLQAERYFDVRSQAALLENIYKVACNNFNIAIASEVWRVNGVAKPITSMLAHKLNLLADLPDPKIDFNVGDMLIEHARYIASVQKRVNGLEKRVNESDESVAERDGQIALLNQHIEAYRTSTSWRITVPLRYAGHQLKRARDIASVLLQLVQNSGGVNATFFKALQILRREGIQGIKRRWRTHHANIGSRNDYQKWILRYDTLDEERRRQIRDSVKKMQSPPLISVVMPTYNSDPKWLSDAIESVRSQLYPYWELCIADDASTDPRIHSMLEDFAQRDARIKINFREINGHISVASNTALDMVSGEWIALLDHDDKLSETALYYVAQQIISKPDARMIYSDEDKIDESDKRHGPYFKCDWNPDLFYSHNMFCHLGVYQTELVRTVGGFRKGFEGAQDYDLALRCMERVTANQISHIPKVLYHWRVHIGSTAANAEAKPYAMLAGERALNEHFQRTSVQGRVTLIDFGYRAKYRLPADPPLVSLLIPTRDQQSVAELAVRSILNKTTYPNYEIIIIDNGSAESETINWFADIQAEDRRVRVIRYDYPFNYSAINNFGVSKANGSVIGLINNDVEVISPEWLSEMVSHAVRTGIGCVGAKLYYPDGTLQHGGVITGIGGFAGHSHKHFPAGSNGYAGRLKLLSNFSAVTGACLVVKKDIFEAVGGLDEKNFKVALNDVDFCLKVREKGYRNLWTPYAELYHYESVSRGLEDNPEKQARFQAEVNFMKEKWGIKLLEDPCYSPNLTLDYEDFSLAWPPRYKIVL